MEEEDNVLLLPISHSIGITVKSAYKFMKSKLSNEQLPEKPQVS